MLTIACTCDDPHCSGTVEFSTCERRSHHGRAIGRCDRCRSLYSLYGGQVRLEARSRVAAASGADQ